jgi:predicted ribosome quality control (RQC) complex YloA/Tae2 family protein
MDRLDRCPNPETLRAELSELQTKLKSLQHLEEAIKKVKSQSDPTFLEFLLPIITELEITDEAPPEQERGPKKVKGPRVSEPRMPYIKYTSADGIEIRVGRSASDNDELSCNPVHRDGCKLGTEFSLCLPLLILLLLLHTNTANWWLHVAGYPGSHVVIRTDVDDVQERFKETVKDAALLCAVKSKVSSDVLCSFYFVLVMAESDGLCVFVSWRL